MSWNYHKIRYVYRQEPTFNSLEGRHTESEGPGSVNVIYSSLIILFNDCVVTFFISFTNKKKTGIT